MPNFKNDDLLEPVPTPTMTLRWVCLMGGWHGYGPFGIGHIDAAGNTDHYQLQQLWSDGKWHIVPLAQLPDVRNV